MRVTKEGSVRVDLVGGTLDLDPIHLILKNVITLNVATSLKALVCVEKNNEMFIEIESKDYKNITRFDEKDFSYQNLYENDFFGPMKFVCQILDYFKIHKGLKITLESGAPAGSGLGGSSAMGVTLFSALADLLKQKFTRLEIVNKTKGIESRILNQGIAGYQDFYPALYGGILALKAAPGEVKVEQLYTPELKKYLESCITLVFSGKSRLSGFNNWELYKSFFDKDPHIRQGLAEIAEISYLTYQSIVQKSYQKTVEFIGQEGEKRAKLFPGINSEEMRSFYATMKKELPNTGMKVCGAGGGGCFIICHKPEDKKAVSNFISNHRMQKLDFCIEQPLDEK